MKKLTMVVLALALVFAMGSVAMAVDNTTKNVSSVRIEKSEMKRHFYQYACDPVLTQSFEQGQIGCFLNFGPGIKMMPFSEGTVGDKIVKLPSVLISMLFMV